MKRSQWKISYMHPIFFRKSFYTKSPLILSRFRNSIVSSKLIGSKIHIYNGAWLLTRLVEPNMVGHKIGSFSITKKFDCQAQNKRKSKRKTKK